MPLSPRISSSGDKYYSRLFDFVFQRIAAREASYMGCAIRGRFAVSTVLRNLETEELLWGKRCRGLSGTQALCLPYARVASDQPSISAFVALA